MKIVINDCYGGFGLSIKALKRLIAEGSAGITVEDFVSGGDNTHDADGYATDQLRTCLFKDGKCYDYNENNRTDPALVRAVEEMGAMANGQYADLKVVEIPDDAGWGLSEHDGKESIMVYQCPAVEDLRTGEAVCSG